MIEIKSIYGAVIFRHETAETLCEALVEASQRSINLIGANLIGANLIGANLIGAYLRDANLRGAYLSYANLSGANLRGADLSYVNLSGVNLSGVNLSGVNLSGANLRGANLRGANLIGAYLEGAYLRDANLIDANLEGIKDDVFAVLSAAPREAPGVLHALRHGKVNGSQYEGECACLVGTIANTRGCHYKKLTALKPDSERPAEKWFLAIQTGDTPANSPVSKITAEWVEEWLRNNGIEPEPEVDPSLAAQFVNEHRELFEKWEASK